MRDPTVRAAAVAYWRSLLRSGGRLDDPALWGGPVDDERFAVLAT